MKPEPGDLILYPVDGRSNWVSRLVGAGQLVLGIGGGAELYSHVAVLAATPGEQFESKWPRSGRFPIDKARPYEIWRVGSPTQDQRRIILRWCIDNVRRWYNMTGLLTDGLLHVSGTFVCSEFAGAAYRAAGIKLHQSNRVLAPDDLCDQPTSKLIHRYDPRGGA